MGSLFSLVTLLLILGGCSATHPQLTPPPPLTAEPHKSEKAITLPKEEPLLAPEIGVDLPELPPQISDLDRFPQHVAPYAERNAKNQEELLEIQKGFESQYYRPWNYSVPPIGVAEVSWPIRAFRGGYGSNLQPVPSAWLEQLSDQSNFEAYGSVNQKGIALEWTNLRAFPTDKPLFNNPALPGEGYPFDLLQNSSVNFNEPLFISHYSKDGSWCYVFSNSASGWVKNSSVAVLDDAMIASIKGMPKVFLIEDNIPMKEGTGRFIAYSRIGMVLPLECNASEGYKLTVVDRNGSFTSVSIDPSYARVGVSKLNKADLIHIGEQLMKNTYGWGGMFGERDCSSMIRDLYAPFGIWLPRNSSAQAKKGEVISFEGLSDGEKLDLIREKGVPFETIIYLKGHVLLYVGEYQGNVMVMHDIWGIRTITMGGKKGRHIIGKAVISTLELGAELEDYDPSQKLLTRALSMNIFTHPSIMPLSKGEKPHKKIKRTAKL